MYSSRRTTVYHGNHQFYLLFIVLLMCITFTLKFGKDYLVMYLSSGLGLWILELGLSLTGARKSTVYLFGKKLPKLMDSGIRAFVEGPGMCLPSFLMADQLMAKNYTVAILVPAATMTCLALYSGIMDRVSLSRLKPDEKPIYSRRKMTRAGVVMGVAFLNLACLIAMFMMPAPFRTHAVYFCFAFFILMELFFWINYFLGVRMIERFDDKKKEFYTPGIGFEVLGFTYDSVFEMALLNMPYYLVPFGLGLFQYATISV